ncbi:MAG: hypothetical protein KDD69_06670 [Bdellovibrionales bacterium]|nr:hypothetical protein [Bdellovibrionales bacterium]
MEALRSLDRTSYRCWLLLACALFAFSAVGCAVGGGDNDDETADESEQEGSFRLSAVTNDRGDATVSFDLPEGTTKFAVTALLGDDDLFVRFSELVSGTGVDYLSPERESISFADTFSRYVNTASVPSRREDPALTNGERYTASIELEDGVGTPISGETVTFEVISKVDPGLDGGRLRLNVFFVGDVGEEQTTKEVIRAAIPTMRSTYSAQAGLDLDINEFEIDGPVVLPLPVTGDDFYRSAAGVGVSPSVNLFIGGDVDARSAVGEVLGVAGGIPGPPTPTERSGVAVSIFAAAGPDGIFSAEDTRILGETLAHETGHFLGLFHPVDFSGSQVTAADPLDDTAICGFITECISNSELTRNLMFPSPVSDGSGGFIPQNDLTDDQRGVMNRYIVAD